MSDTRDRLLTAPFLWLMAAHFLQALGFSSMILLPRYLDFLGATRTDIGAIMGAAAFGGLAVRPLVGWALDTVGRKPTLFAGTVVMSSAMWLVGSIDAVDWLPYLVRILFGVGVGACFTGYFTMAADVIPDSRRTEGLALFGVSGLLPLAVNPLSDRSGVAPGDVGDFLPWMGVAILCSILPLMAVPDRRSTTERPPFDVKAAFQALRARPLLPVWLADLVFSGLVAVFMAFAIVVAQDRGIPNPADVWFAYVAGAVSVRSLGAKLPEKIGLSRLLGPVLLCYVASVALIAVADSQWTMGFAGLLAGLGHGYSFPILSAQTVTRAPDALRGSAMAVFTGLWDVTKIIAAPLCGALGDRLGDTGMLQVVAGIGLFGVASWALLEWRTMTPDAVEGRQE